MTMLLVIVRVILPIFILIGVGAAADRTLKPDLRTLGKLNFWIFVPALLFVKLLDAELAPKLLAGVAAFATVHMGILFLTTLALVSLKPLRPFRSELQLGALFYNAGNYGIPLVLLAFPDSDPLPPLAIVLMVQNFFSFTLGLWLVCGRELRWHEALASFLKVPAIWAIAMVLILRFAGVTPAALPVAIWEPLSYLANGLIPIALITLGVQLSRTSLNGSGLFLTTAVAWRLLVSPVAAFVLLFFFSFPPTVADVLLLVSGLPVAVNVYILSLEYEKKPELASQMIFWSTLISALTISLLLYLIRL